MEAEKFICDHCGREYQDLAAHLRWHPECDDDGDMPELHEDSDDYDFEDGFDLEAAQDAFEGMRERNDLKDLVALDLADERLEHGNGNADVDRLKRKVDAWVKERDASAHLALKPLLRPEVTAEQVQAALGSRGIFEGIETAKTEMAYTKQRVPYIEPRVVQLSEDKDDKVVSFDIGELLERDLQSNANLRRRMIETSDRLKTGELCTETYLTARSPTSSRPPRRAFMPGCGGRRQTMRRMICACRSSSTVTRLRCALPLSSR